MNNIGLITTTGNCPSCGNRIERIYYNDNAPYKRCNNRSCNRPKQYLFKGSIFEKTRIGIRNVLLIIYYFACRRTLGDTAETLGIDRRTIKEYYDLLRANVHAFCDYNVQIGSDVVNIHLDETPITFQHNNISRTSRGN